MPRGNSLPQFDMDWNDLMSITLSTPLELPCGAILPNRIVKAAMSEGMADARNHSTPRLEALYRRWGASGAGLLLSGNIQVDADHLERPLNIVLEGRDGLEALGRLASTGKEGGAKFWAQISHTGRQVDSHINPAPLAPSVVELDVLRGAGFSFAVPHAMSEAQIQDAIGRFARSAALARDAGFDGVQLHAAHGYLISQFLSGHTNKRSDGWGGPLAQRARFLIEVIAAVRAAVGADFPIGIKLNASDFQKGAFTNADCIEVVGWLNETSLDLIELSGGSLEQPKVVGIALKDEGVDGRSESTKAREAYFIDFAAGVHAAATMPVMVTGGFRTLAGMQAALEDGDLDLVGIGRPMIADPECPRKLLAGEIEQAPAPERALDLFHLMGWFNMQLERLGDGLDPDLNWAGADAAATFAALETGNMQALLTERATRRAA
ncbi:MAG: NADH:flavin oxidoreductase/NADH oxidase family protein [Sphingomonas sp.]|jgi:2,4-dienoyl-CoA reductase-like NADH-dependent reductase (Old Yellow Enzyme family)|uniref:NADH:flavin oxidoreductase/NADH oxidase family protein n=1 Tax=Sphingomonas sp. TaxID=28214 RepID=UPI0035685D27